MAGFYETIMSMSAPTAFAPAPTTPTVFGNAATTPSNIAASNAKIDYLRQAIANAQAKVTAEQSAYDTAMGEYNRRMAPSNSKFWGSAILASPIWRNSLAKNATSAASTAPAYTNVSNARTALIDAQNELNEAIAMQKMQKIAGQEAVAQGLAAKTAEQQGIANAAKMYQQAMQGEAVRNAIMNGAIGTVGSFGGVK